MSASKYQTPRQAARHLVVMVKEPRAGNVKTRLGRTVGAVPATEFYRKTLAQVIGRLRTGPWQTILAVAPRAAMASNMLPANLPRISQGGGDLGDRMQRVMEQTPPGPTLIIGTDIPGIDKPHIARAFACLGTSDAVLGPAPDGGYWCVGFRRTPRIPKAFQNVRWSAPETLADTVASLKGLTVAHGEMLVDVDTAEELIELGPSRGRRILPRLPQRAA